jgi:phosphatidylserine/phosphatidylglycerophosphate/cardiolipin synthase-like enzyme
MIRALTDAQRRGVRVVVLLPGKIDTAIVRLAGRSRFGELPRAGIEIYEYQAGLLHAKTMIVDGVWATIDSTNLDRRSFALNEEVNLVVYNQDVAARLEEGLRRGSGVLAQDRCPAVVAGLGAGRPGARLSLPARSPAALAVRGNGFLK